MISVPDRQRAVELIDEATAAGARRFKACAELRISERTYRRWTVEGAVRADQRPEAPHPTPGNKLSDEERQAVLEVCHSEEFASLPPVFVKAVVRRVHAASLILRAPVARSGFSQTSATGAQLRGCPDHRSGLAARAAAQRQARWASTV